MPWTGSQSGVGEEMTVLDSRTTADLRALMSRYGDNRAKRELLLFWALHPRARFSRLAILCATECSRSDVDEALRTTVETGLVDIQCHNGSPVYSLTSNEDVRRVLAVLSTLDWSQKHSLFDQIRLADSPGGPATRREAA